MDVTEIRIGGYLAASFLLAQEPRQQDTIVMLDSGKQAADFVKTNARSFLYLSFDDVE